jgi:hypothetical protein
VAEVDVASGRQGLSMGATRWVETDAFEVYRELFRVLAARRRPVHADEMARRLLRHENGVRDLVGVTADGERALVYHRGARVLVAVRFDEHGVSAAVDETLVRDLGAPADWVTARGGDLAWVHPRYCDSAAGER